MPWLETSPVEQRGRFIADDRLGLYTRAELCARYALSRKTGYGVWCYPLTLADPHTRYLLACRGLPSTQGRGARPVFERAFREFGLPRAIRTDNRGPFATCGIHGLSQLNVWWMLLGIQHQRIHPASPQENGAHERMHKTLMSSDTQSYAAEEHPSLRTG